MEKETQEAAENYANKWYESTGELSVFTAVVSKNSFIAGAKWQSERMYSEEDLEYAFEQGKLNSNICYRRTFKNVLEILQFKKK